MAQTTTLTANEIIDLALRRIGNTSNQAVLDAQAELNNILDRLYIDFRWDFLKSTTSGNLSAGGTNIALPANYVDFWERQAVYLVDSNNGTIRLTVISQPEIDMVHNPAATGTPRYVLANLSDMTWAPWPIPTKSYTYYYTYRRKANRISDFNAIVSFPNEALLIQLIFSWACGYEDDDRFPLEMALSEKMLRAFLKQQNAGSNKNRRTALSPSVFSTPQLIR